MCAYKDVEYTTIRKGKQKLILQTSLLDIKLIRATRLTTVADWQ